MRGSELRARSASPAVDTAPLGVVVVKMKSEYSCFSRVGIAGAYGGLKSRKIRFDSETLD